jgi:hypothetical protein
LAPTMEKETEHTHIRYLSTNNIIIIV